MNISIIIPVYNEEESVARLHAELKVTLESYDIDYEIIFVDDGSRDTTFEVLKGLNPVKVIRFRRNFGQTAALDAGFKAARGEVIVSMDGDLQDDPAEMHKLLSELGEETDVVVGARSPRRDAPMKKFVSWGAYLLRQGLLKDGVKDSGTTYRAYKKEALANLDLYGEEHRVIPALLQLRGFKIAEVPVNHRPRLHGQTKYDWKRTLKGFLDIINVWFWQKYSARPLHFFGGLGLSFFFTRGPAPRLSRYR